MPSRRTGLLLRQLTAVLMVGVAALAPQAAPPAAPEPAPRTDFAGDPLPPGALARLGTLRLRHRGNVCSLAFSPDGKALISGGHDNTVHVADAATGKLIHLFRGTELEYHGALGVLSPDGKTLYTTTDRTVRAWDLGTGKEVRGLPKGLRADAIALSPKGDLLACTGGPGSSPSGNETGIRLRDLAAAKEVHRIGGEDHFGFLVFTPDSRALAALGGGLRADASVRGHPLRLWDVKTGKQLPSPTGEANDVTSFVLSPDGKTCAVTRQGEADVVRLLETATGKERRRLKTTLPCLCFSPDGARIVGRGYDGLRLWDAATGEEVRAFDGINSGTAAFSPDGKTLAAADGLAVRRWDVETARERSYAAGPTGPVSGVALAPDGKTVAVAEGHSVRLWDWSTGKEPLRLAKTGNVNTVCSAFSPDGKTLAAGAATGLSVWDAATGKVTRAMVFPQSGSPGVHALAFSPDGKALAWADTAGGIRQWKADPKENGPTFAGHELFSPVESLAYAADGKTLTSVGRDRTVRRWDATTGKELRRFEGLPDKAAYVALAPDGGTLAWSGAEKGLGVWEFAAGKSPRPFPGDPGPAVWLAFSPDGKSLATGGIDLTVRLWELATGKERRRLEGHQGIAGPFSFSRDGNVLASASQDTTVVIWDVFDLFDDGRRPAARLSDKEAAALWGDLAGADAAGGYAAMKTLMRAPGQAVPCLGERVRPARPADEEALARLVTDLDSDRFEVREKAAEKLEDLGWGAEAALGKALRGRPSAEVRRRAEGLLEKLRARTPTPEELRELRAVEVLEHAGTPEARRLLESLAKGAAEARLTREAKASLERLGKRAP